MTSINVANSYCFLSNNIMSLICVSAMYLAALRTLSSSSCSKTQVTKDLGKGMRPAFAALLSHSVCWRNIWLARVFKLTSLWLDSFRSCSKTRMSSLKLILSVSRLPSFSYKYSCYPILLTRETHIKSALALESIIYLLLV